MTNHQPYDQFLLFGDSITQQAGCQDRGFAFAPALQDGNSLKSLYAKRVPWFSLILERKALLLARRSPSLVPLPCRFLSYL